MAPPLHTKTKTFAAYGRKRAFNVASIHTWATEELAEDRICPPPERVPLSPKKSFSANIIPTISRPPLTDKTPQKGPASFPSALKTPSPVIFVKPRKGGRPLVVHSPVVSAAKKQTSRQRRRPKTEEVIIIDGEDDDGGKDRKARGSKRSAGQKIIVIDSEEEDRDASGDWEDCEPQRRPRRVRKLRASKGPDSSSPSSDCLRPLLETLSQDSPQSFSDMVEKLPLLERGTWSKIGEATFSEVYIARDAETGEEVVVKIIPLLEDKSPQWDRGPHRSGPEDVIREIRVLRQLQNVDGFVGLLG
jgi:hypothetical protein